MSVYAIGDIHGCFAELDQLVKLILVDIDERKDESATVVFLGDYIDRGPASMQVIDLLISLPKKYPNIEFIFLMGNHEDMCLFESFNWLYNESYGGATIKSYESKFDQFDTLETKYNIHMKEHLEWMSKLKVMHVVDNCIFVHADIPYYAQSITQLQEMTYKDQTFMWSRRHSGKYKNPDWCVIHGHTPSEKIIKTRDNINIDTGCVFGYYLTGIRIDDTKTPKIDRIFQIESKLHIKRKK